MPNLRRLSYRDRYVWYLTQTMAGGSSVLPPLSFQDNVPLDFIVRMTGNEFNQVLSALMTGADLSYPEQSHETVWMFLKNVEYPIMLPPPAGNDNRVDLWARFAGVNFTPVVQSTANQLFSHYVQQSAPAGGDNYFWDLWLTPGTYGLNVVWARELNSANAQIFWQPVSGGSGTIIGTINMHGLFLTSQVTSFTFAMDEPQQIRIAVQAVSLPPGSTGYRMNLTMLNLFRMS